MSYENPWIYNGEVFESSHIQDWFGFVYHIHCPTTGRSYVIIKLGYDQNLVTEFEGYIKEIIAIDGSLKIECEDALFLFRNDVKDKQFQPASVKQIAEYLVSQIDKTYKVVCDYDIGYEKFAYYLISPILS